MVGSGVETYGSMGWCEMCGEIVYSVGSNVKEWGKTYGSKQNV